MSENAAPGKLPADLSGFCLQLQPEERKMNAMTEYAALSRDVAQPLTLANTLPTFLATRRTRLGKPLSDQTKADYTKWYRIALAPAKDWPLANVSVMQWVDFLTGVKSKYGEAKALYMSNIVSAVYSFLMGLDMLDANPITKVRLSRLFIAPAPKDTYIPIPQLRPFFRSIDRALTRQDSKDAVKLLFMTGFRLSAALGLKWDSLDLDRGFYYVPAGAAGWKGFTGVMPLSDYVVNLLRRRHERRESHIYVFPKRCGGSSAPMTSVGDALQIVCEAASVDRVSAHDLRRTLATVAKFWFGAEIDKVAVLLGHKWAVDGRGMVVSKSAITTRYIQTELVSLRAMANEAARCLLELVGEGPMSEGVAARLEKSGYRVK